MTVASAAKEDGGFELAMETAATLRDAGKAADAVSWLAGVKGGSAEDERWRLETLATTQERGTGDNQNGRPLVREGTAEEYKKNPKFVEEMEAKGLRISRSLFSVKAPSSAAG